jgi:simple sugar transport system substrate-binding protein
MVHAVPFSENLIFCSPKEAHYENFRRKTLVAAMSLAVFGLAACGKKEEAKPEAAPASTVAATAAAEPLKVGFIYVSSRRRRLDLCPRCGTQTGRSQIRRQSKTTFVENVPESAADAERVIRDLATQGNKVIFGTTFGYMEAMLKVAKDFPDVKFEHATGYKTADNLAQYDVRTYEGAYLAGIAAGKLSKSGKLGVVASVPIPEVLRNINAFTLGARAVNPKATTKVVWVNKWFDPGKEREAATTLVGQGVDVLMQNTDSAAVVQTAEEKAWWLSAGIAT